MGQEWAASAPFLFFSNHGGELGAAVSNGRREEFKSFAAFADPSVRARIPDPEALSTFEASRLRWDEREEPGRSRVLDLHRWMLGLRQTDPVLSNVCRDGQLEARVIGEDLLEVTRRGHDGDRVLVVNFARTPRAFEIPRGARVLVGSRPIEDAALPPETAVLLALERA
jgi:maltooligosyltrehalose trehalohydrolase